MKLSKFFGMLFVASLAMASCSNDDITGDGPDINGGFPVKRPGPC